MIRVLQHGAEILHLCCAWSAVRKVVIFECVPLLAFEKPTRGIEVAIPAIAELGRSDPNEAIDPEI